MSPCGRHRDFLSAIADGQRDLVPPETDAHVLECDECGRELETQRRLTRLLVRAARPGEAEVPAPRRPLLPLRRAAAAASVLLLACAVIATLGWRAAQDNDQVATAVSVAAQAPQLRSTDGVRIKLWCEQEAERPVPEISTASLQPTGARMDRHGADEIVTVTYVTGEHRTIRVSWIDGRLAAAGTRAIRARSVSGMTVLVVTSGAGTAVLSGDAPLHSMWQAAARIQTTT